jgi:hypothetical protein
MMVVVVPRDHHPRPAVPVITVVSIPLPRVVVVMVVVVMVRILRWLETHDLVAHNVVSGEAGARVRHRLEKVSVAESRRNRVRGGQVWRGRRRQERDGGCAGQPDRPHLHRAVLPFSSAPRQPMGDDLGDDARRQVVIRQSRLVSPSSGLHAPYCGKSRRRWYGCPTSSGCPRPIGRDWPPVGGCAFRAARRSRGPWVRS